MALHTERFDSAAKNVRLHPETLEERSCFFPRSALLELGEKTFYVAK